MSVESPEVESIRKMFEEMDTDKDGYISLEDYTSSGLSASVFENAWQFNQVAIPSSRPSLPSTIT